MMKGRTVLSVDESQRQIALIALAKLRVERPGWDYVIGEIETKLGGQLKWPAAMLRRNVSDDTGRTAFGRQ